MTLVEGLPVLCFFVRVFVVMQTVAVAKEGAALNTKDARLLVVVCTITVLPGNPTKLVLEGEDWDTVRVKAAPTTIV